MISAAQPMFRCGQSSSVSWVETVVSGMSFGSCGVVVVRVGGPSPGGVSGGEAVGGTSTVTGGFSGGLSVVVGGGGLSTVGIFGGVSAVGILGGISTVGVFGGSSGFL